MREKLREMTMTKKIMYSLIFGAIFGLILHYRVPAGHVRDDIIIESILYSIGQIFIRLMQMLVVPLVFFSIVDGTRNIGDSNTLGKVGARITLLYLFTTAMAVAIAIALANLIKPGVGMNMTVGSNEFEVKSQDISIRDTLIGMFTTNPVQSLSEGNMLQIIVFAVICGLMLARLDDKVSTLSNIVSEMNDLMMEMTGRVMGFAPIGVFCLLSRTFANLGYDVIFSMAKYMATVFAGLFSQLLLVYMVLLALFVRINPFKFLKKFSPVMAFAFSTASSNSAVPMNIQTLEDLGVDRKIASFTIPFGATVNMDGTAIMQGVAAIFIANAYDIPLEVKDYLTIILTATIASVGTAGIPSVGLVTLAMVLSSVGIPTEGIAMIMGIDRILDMSRTAVNITGDATCTLIVANSVGSFDKEKYKRA